MIPFHILHYNNIIIVTEFIHNTPSSFFHILAGQLTATTGAANFTQLAPGSYKLVVIARNKDKSDKAVIRSDELTIV